MKGVGPGHVSDLLPAYLNGTLGARDERSVDEHLKTCASCRAALASWEVVQEATVTASERMPAPPADALDKVWSRIDRDEMLTRAGSRALTSKLSLSWQLLKGQVPLVRREIWTASAVTMAVGWFVALAAPDPTLAGAAFAVFAPLIAAVGVAFIYGPQNDPALEIALSTPTSSRLVLLCRLTLVYGYDLVLALIVTAVLALAKGGVDPWPLISLWIGPMLFLSALILLLSLLVGATVATFVAMSLWAIKLVAASYAARILIPAGGAELVDAFWRANPVLLSLTALLLAVVLFYAPRSERLVW